jgi:hypothetical protein
MARTHKRRGGFSLSSLFSSAKRGVRDIASGFTSGVKYVGRVGETGVKDVSSGVSRVANKTISTVRKIGGKHRMTRRHHKRRGGYKNPNIVSSYAPITGGYANPNVVSSYAPITGGYANPNVKVGYAPVSEGYSNQVPLTTPYQYNSLDRAYPSSATLKGGYRNPNVESHLNELSDAYPMRIGGRRHKKSHRSRRHR